MKTINYSKNIALATVAALGVASLAIAAHADEAQVPARTVRYSDLNLDTQAGAEVLYKRIRNAAEQVCGDVGSRQMEEAMAARACVDQAVVTSIRAVNNLRVTNTYNAHLGAAQTT